MQAGIDPAELALPRRPVAGHGMDVAVNEPWRQRHTIGVDRRRRAGKVEVGSAADRADAPVNRDDSVGVEDRSSKVAAENEAYVLNNELGRSAVGRFLMRPSGISPRRLSRRISTYTPSRRSGIE
jgi:hypothetical protein